MFTLVITEKGGAQKRMDFDKSEITIGRVQGNDVILPKGNVSKRHSRIVLKDNRFIVVDLKSTNGTYVNGRKITSPLVVKSGDKIYIGDFILTLDEAAGAGAGAGANAPSAPPPEPAAPSPPSFRSATAPPRSVPDPAPPPLMGGGGPMNGPGMGPPPLGGPPMGAGPAGPPSVVASPPAMPTPAAAPTAMGGGGMGPPPMGGGGMGPPPPMGGPMGGGPMGGGPMGGGPMGAPMAAPPPMSAPPMGPPPLGAAAMSAAPVAMGGPPPSRRSTASPVPGPPPPARSPERFPLEEEPSEEYSAAGPGVMAAAAAPPIRAVPAPAAVGRGPGPGAMPAAPPAPGGAAAGARGPSRVPGPPVPTSGPLARGPGAGAVPPLRPVQGGAAGGSAPATARPAPPPPSSGPPNVLRTILDRVAQTMDVRSVDIGQLRDEGHWDRAERSIAQVVDRMAGEGALPPAADRGALARDALHEAVGLGALEELLSDEAVSEIHVNGTEPVVVERDGRLETTERAFSSEDAVFTAVRRMLAPLGRDLTGPVVEARLADGTSLTAVLAPVAVRGAFVSLRRARRSSSSLSTLVQSGALSQGVAEFLEACMAARRNVLVAGSSAADAAPLVSALCAATSSNERVVLVEPAPDVAAPSHVVTLEASSGADGASPVPIRQVLAAALRARADRLFVADLRGAESRDAVEAAAGRDGVVMSVAAAGPREALTRLENASQLAGEAPAGAIRSVIGAAVHIVVGITRQADGVRRVTSVHVVDGAIEGGYSTADVFIFQSAGMDANGAVVGRWVPTGYVPPFVEQLRAAGVAVGNSMFRE